VLPGLFLVALLSCGDSAIFLAPVDEPAQVRIQTIESGSILPPGSSVPLAVERDAVFTGDAESADRLQVELLDPDGVLLGEQTYESVDQADELPALLLPDLGEGLFILRTTYLDGDEVIVTQDTPFYISAGIYEILGLSSFPATFYPGSTGLLSLNLSTPVGSDPWLEWYLDDERFLEGPLSEIGTTGEITVPGDTGAYTVRVELFPSHPVLSSGTVPASVSYSTELLVTTDPPLEASDLTPERNYFTLYHYQGDTRDSGARPELFPSVSWGTRLIGDPALAVGDDIFGYRLGGDDGFQTDGFALPVRDGVLTPFSLTLRLRPEDSQVREAIVRMETPGATLFELFRTSSGALAAVVNGGSAEVETGAGAIAPEVTSVVTVTVLPVDDRTLLQIYVDGNALATETVSWNASTASLPEAVAETDEGWMALPGLTTVGGAGGFTGIVDEFGVYFRDSGDQPSADTDIFKSAMELVHGEELVYAEGFEGADLPDDVAYEGPAQIDTGRLILGTGASAFFPVFAFSSEELLVDISLEALPGSLIRFYLGNRERPTRADMVLEVLAADTEAEGTQLDFRFVHSDSILVVTHPSGEETTIDLDSGGAFTGLRLQVSQTGQTPARIAVESVVAWRENPEIPASLLEPPGDSPASPDSESSALPPAGGVQPDNS